LGIARGGRAALALVAGTAVAVMALLPAPSAHASCASRKPREQLARADAAFVGRLLDRSGDRLTFAVDRSVKGDLGDRVEVEDAAPRSSLSLRPAAGVQVGLFLSRRHGRGFVASDCDVVTPEAMRAAAASGRSTCSRPRVLGLRVRRRELPRTVRVRAAVGDADGEVTAIDIAWGDGTVTRTTPREPRGSVVRDHRYRRAGRFRIAVVARSAPTLDCGSDDERSAVRARVVSIR
jgi:hypothetical protein